MVELISVVSVVVAVVVFFGVEVVLVVEGPRTAESREVELDWEVVG